MKVKVVISFHDAGNFALVHKVGDVLEVSEERAQKLIDLGLVKKAEEKKPKVEEPKAEEPVDEAPKVTEEPKRSRRSRR